MTDDELLALEIPSPIRERALITLVQYRHGQIDDAQYRNFFTQSEVHYAALFQLHFLFELANDLNEEQRTRLTQLAAAQVGRQ